MLSTSLRYPVFVSLLLYACVAYMPSTHGAFRQAGASTGITAQVTPCGE